MSKVDTKALREAAEKLGGKQWYISTCNNGESCWCRCIGELPPDHPDTDNMEYCVAPSGSISKDDAEFIALADPANILQLLDELEDYQRVFQAASDVVRQFRLWLYNTNVTRDKLEAALNTLDNTFKDLSL